LAGGAFPFPLSDRLDELPCLELQLHDVAGLLEGVGRVGPFEHVVDQLKFLVREVDGHVLHFTGKFLMEVRRIRRPSPNVPTWGNANEERLVDEALRAAEIPGAVLAQKRPPLPQIELWRPRMGYDQHALSITEVLAVGRLYQDRRWDTSGGPHDFQASSRMSESPF
jgi:hypothetical protein